MHFVSDRIWTGEKMTVYLDVVFLENIIINYIIIYATGIISKTKIKQIARRHRVVGRKEKRYKKLHPCNFLYHKLRCNLNSEHPCSAANAEF